MKKKTKSKHQRISLLSLLFIAIGVVIVSLVVVQLVHNLNSSVLGVQDSKEMLLGSFENGNETMNAGTVAWYQRVPNPRPQGVYITELQMKFKALAGKTYYFHIKNDGYTPVPGGTFLAGTFTATQNDQYPAWHSVRFANQIDIQGYYFWVGVIRPSNQLFNLDYASGSDGNSNTFMSTSTGSTKVPTKDFLYKIYGYYPSEASPTPTTAQCKPSDINKDGQVNAVDRTLVVNNLFINPGDTNVDVNSDGIVDITDYSLVVKDFNTSTGPCK